MKMSLGLSGCNEENALQQKKREGGSKNAAPAGESKGFLLLVSQGQHGKRYISLRVLFPLPLFMHLQLT